MRTVAVPLGLAMLAMLAGCVKPTPYQPVVDGYGYSEQQVEDARFWVRFAGNHLTSPDTVQNYWLYRAAELTLDHGYTTSSSSTAILIVRPHTRAQRTAAAPAPIRRMASGSEAVASAAIPPRRGTAIRPSPTWS
jgi:hypothetical protein